MQEVYINVDDSGKLSTKEDYSAFGGVIFLSKNEKDKFITQYRAILNDIKCKYCRHISDNCKMEKCPEIKNSKIKSDHKRRIINYIKGYRTFSCIINNKKIYPHIINNKASKGRYTDYAQKLIIKQIFKDLIKDKLINPNNQVKLILNIDEQTTKSNGYYNLKDSIIEEFLFGIHSYNYGFSVLPILFNTFDIQLNYQDSSKSLTIQAADFVAGTIRKIAINCKDNDYNKVYKALNFIDSKIFLP